jgi:hypothetical protein
MEEAPTKNCDESGRIRDRKRFWIFDRRFMIYSNPTTITTKIPTRNHK